MSAPTPWNTRHTGKQEEHTEGDSAVVRQGDDWAVLPMVCGQGGKPHTWIYVRVLSRDARLETAIAIRSVIDENNHSFRTEAV